MDKTIEKIIEIEYKAQSIVNEVLHNSENHSNAQIEKEIKKEKDCIFYPVIQRVQKEREDKLSYANIQAQKIASDAKTKVSNLNKMADSNKERWINSLLGGIIGSEQS